MEDLLQQIKPILLMGPGPSCVSDDAYKALQNPTLGHLDPVFIAIMDGIKEHLKAVFHTTNEMTLTISGTGSAGMETCFVNLVEPGDKVLVMLNGVFGARQKEVAERLGAIVDTLEIPFGHAILPEEVEEKLADGPYKIVSIVHAETSAGVLNPIDEIAPIVKETGALLLVDCVTSLGCIPVKVDEWQADAVYSCSQKGLSCPPGLSPVTFSPQAMEMIKARKTKVPNWYLDLTLLEKYWSGSPRAYHHTAPSNLYYALYAGLRALLIEGEEHAFARQLAAHNQLVEGLGELGLRLTVDEDDCLPVVNVVGIPEGINDAEVRSRLLNEFQIEIGSGLGELAGKVWRIGLMGQTSKPENVTRLLDALTTILKTA